MKVKEENEKTDLKLNIQKMKIIASGPITSWQIDGKTDWSQIRKVVCQGCILLPCLFNLYAEYIMQHASWMKHKLESRLLGEISVSSDMQMTPPLWYKAKKN